MNSFVQEFGAVLFSTALDVAPILVLILFFQFFVLKKPVPNVKRVILGSVYVVVGLAMFLLGLEKALFPIGEMMAAQLSDAEFLGVEGEALTAWYTYYWIYIFAAAIGFATAVAEPALIAVAMKANEASGGSIGNWRLRIFVALGVAFALVLGTFRIVTGTPLYLYIMAGYAVVIVQTIFAPKHLIALAYDSGGVATSTVTVPIVAALGLGLSAAVPGRNPAVDGFGLIALACLFPIIAVLGYAQYSDWILRKKNKKQ